MNSFPNQSYNQLFLEGMDVVKILSVSDDGAHQLPGDKFFEWWYFDVSFDEGYHLVVVFHTALFNVSSRPTVIVVHLYGPDGLKIVEVVLYNSSDIKLSKQKCDLEFGYTKVVDNGKHYLLSLNEKRIQANLEFHRLLEGIKVGTGSLFFDETSNQSFHWNIPIPRAHVIGLLKIDGNELKVFLEM